jgi:hypothetical protein
VAQTANNIVLPGPVKVFVAPYSYTALQAAPASSVAYGSDWSGTWVEVGFTKGGAVLKPETEAYLVEVDQVAAPVESRIVKQGATMTFAAAEATLTNIKQMLGYGTVTTGSTESTLGVSGADSIPTYYTVGFECYAPGADSGDAWYRRVIIWKAMMQADAELKADRGEEMLTAYTCTALWEAQATSTERLYKIIDRVVD